VSLHAKTSSFVPETDRSYWATPRVLSLLPIHSLLLSRKGYKVSQHLINIVDHKQLVKRVEDIRRRSEEIKARMAPVLKRLWCGERELSCVQNLTCFADLRNRFPSFNALIDTFESTSIGLQKLKLPFESVPVLLQGPPGLGKTYFVAELAKALGLPYYEISLATTSASFVLAGGSLQWSEGAVGFIAKTLAESPVANPIVLIDEVDKLTKSDKYSPENVLYSILEPHSAKRFRDEALELELDVSRVIWIATANYPERIPEPILSRMRIVTIDPPSKLQMQSVVESIYINCLMEKPYGQLLNSNLQPAVLEMLTVLTPREARIVLAQACLNAIKADRADIEIVDLPIVAKEKNRVGFI